MLAAVDPTQAPIAGPLIALVAGTAVILLLIARWKVHAFFALFFAATVVGLVVALGGFHNLTLVDAIERPTTKFGEAAGQIALVIAMAAVIGESLHESGAARRIVEWMFRLFGESRAGPALCVASFVLSIPVFFDTVLLLLLPLAREMAVRTGGGLTFYVLAICCGAVVSHSTVPPTPGPLLAAETLQVDFGLAVLGGVACGLIPGAVGLGLSRRLHRRLGEEGTTPEEAPRVDTMTPPSLLASLAPVFVPLVLVSVNSVMGLTRSGEQVHSTLDVAVAFLGNKHVAMFLGMTCGLGLVYRRSNDRTPSLGVFLGRPLENAGVIILITAAGGAFGGMLREAGIAGAIRGLAGGMPLNHVLLAWLIAAVIRIAQGSVTVAMITAAGIMTAVAEPSGWSCHPFWVFLAVGYGGMICSWMNDSGFWLVSRLCGWTERYTLRTFTVVLTAISITGLIEILILSSIFG